MELGDKMIVLLAIQDLASALDEMSEWGTAETIEWRQKSIWRWV